MKQALAMVLAGGKGKRMDILCKERAKPALPFAGRFRVIDFSLSNCIHSQIRYIAVLIDYQRSQMANYLRRWCLSNANLDKFRILEPRTGSYKGTADAVYQNLDYVKRNKTDLVLVLAGDHIYKMDYREMLAFHEQVKADATIGVVPVPVEEAHRFGIVTVDSEGKIVDFVEKPRLPQSNLVSMGIYVFDRDILCERLVEDAAWPSSPHDFGYAILPEMVRRHRVFAFKFNDYWRDIGTAVAYYETNIHSCNGQAPLSLNGGWPILTEEQGLPQSGKFWKGGSVEGSIISQGCVVKGRVENSVLSSGVYVDKLAVIRNSVLMANVFVGYHSVVDRCILDEEVSVGRLCYIGFGKSLISSGSDITVVGKGVTVPNRTAIGHSCKILPHVGPADFTTNVVSPGSVVSKQSIFANTLGEGKVAVK